MDINTLATKGVAIMNSETNSLTFWEVPENLLQTNLEEYLRQNCGYNPDTCTWLYASKFEDILLFKDNPSFNFLTATERLVNTIAEAWPKDVPISRSDYNNHFIENVFGAWIETIDDLPDSVGTYVNSLSEAVYNKIVINQLPTNN